MAKLMCNENGEEVIVLWPDEYKNLIEALEKILAGELTTKNCLRCMSNKNIARAALSKGEK